MEYINYGKLHMTYYFSNFKKCPSSWVALAILDKQMFKKIRKLNHII